MSTSACSCCGNLTAWLQLAALHRVATVVVLGLLASMAAVPAYAAAAPIILVTGPLLAQTVALAKWELNVELMGSGADHPVGQVEAPVGRSYFDLALFTDEKWARYVQAGQPVAALLPEDADEHGRFYPASAGEPALLVLPEVQHRGGVSLTSWSVRQLDEVGLAVLAQNGVPTSLNAADPG